MSGKATSCASGADGAHGPPQPDDVLYRTTYGKRRVGLVCVNNNDVDFEQRAADGAIFVAAPNGKRGNCGGGLSVWSVRLPLGLIDDTELRGLAEPDALACMRKSSQRLIDGVVYQRFALYRASRASLQLPCDWDVCDFRTDGHAHVRSSGAAQYTASLSVDNAYPPIMVELGRADRVTRADLRWGADAAVLEAA